MSTPHPAGTMKRMNIRISGLGGQGAVTAAHLLAMAANAMGKYSISNPFFGAEKRMAPAESYVRVGPDKIYDRGELVFPEIILIFHPQVITMQKSYTAPFYSGIKKGGLIIINTDVDLLSEEDHERLNEDGVSVFNLDATSLALEVGGTELSTNMAMIGGCAGITKVVDMEALDKALKERFGKKYVASGGTATLDEAIKKKYAKKEQLIQKNLDTMQKAFDISSEWAESSAYAALTF